MKKDRAFLPRGVRNNNPFNLKKNPDPKKQDNWLGRVPEEQATDKEFYEFIDPVYGIRAGVMTLLTYQRKYKRKTVAQILSKFAPATENDTRAYIDFVCRRLKVSPDDPIDVSRYDTARALTEAIISFENSGYKYPSSVVNRGLELAGIVPERINIVETRSGKTAIGLGTIGAASLSLGELASFFSGLSWIKDYGNLVGLVIFVVAVLVAIYMLSRRKI